MNHPPITLLPLGSHEYHGPHLPMQTDTLIASSVAAAIAQGIQADSARFPMGVQVFPAIPFSCSHEHADSVSLLPDTLVAVLDDFAAQARGIVAVVNCHGGNHVLENWVLSRNRDRFRHLWFPRPVNWRRACERSGIASEWGEDVHAGEIETSLLLHAAPGEVRADRLPEEHVLRDRPLQGISGMTQYTRDGVLGRPRLGTAAKGEALLKALAALALEEIDLLVRKSS
ncbi:creatininase family protein [Noviherbaspirillum galbum]|uniref:creatininase family protein n=1 Tax=Noviherbaspirillum galbum TaxID=2709383 RepID=UPI001969D6BC|nr:creatininase family protein [Noviherbaspirillum galbum]